MSEILERLRRLHGLREQKRTQPETSASDISTSGVTASDVFESETETEAPDLADGLPEDAADSALDSAPPQPSIPRDLRRAVPGTLIETEAGTCYLSAHAYPLSVARGEQPLGTLLQQPPSILDELYTVGVQAAEARGERLNYAQAAFIDTETSGLGGGSYCFMVGVGTFERLTDPGIEPSLADAAQGETISPTDSGPHHTAPEDLDALPLHENSLLAHLYQTPPAQPGDATHFVVRQFFMRNPGEETALLASLANQLAAYRMTVTFNGRAFDLPMLRSRFRLHRHFLPAATPAPDLLDERGVHIDLLPPARRLWRRRLQSCRLINLEQKILQLYRSEDDVPGHLIPLLYMDFTRSGDARAMRQVFYHNREDIVSMVGIATHITNTVRASTASPRQSAAPALNTPHATAKPSTVEASTVEAEVAENAQPAHTAVSPSLHGHEWLALGQHYVKQNRQDEAIAALEQASQTLTNPLDRALALGELAKLYKKTGQWEQACETWQFWISSIPGYDPTPYIELAKYCEWQSRDLSQAEMWTAWALHNLRQADARSSHRARLTELEHRLQRLQRKRKKDSSTPEDSQPASAERPPSNPATDA
jgi:uncharacterized protein